MASPTITLGTFSTGYETHTSGTFEIQILSLGLKAKIAKLATYLITDSSCWAYFQFG